MRRGMLALMAKKAVDKAEKGSKGAGGARAGKTRAKGGAIDDAGLLGVGEAMVGGVTDQGSGRGAGGTGLVTTLDGIIGQKHAVNVLRSAISSRRVHHAWIFFGPPGVGKFTAAMAFAAELLTTADVGEMTAAQREEILRVMGAGSHLDVHVVSKELASISRDDKVRDSKQKTIAKGVIEEFLLEPATRSRAMSELPLGLASKVFIIDEAELMDTVTQNQVLKTLEEPPEGTVLILVSSDESRLLPTVRSRCQRASFGTLNERDMQAWMQIRGVTVDADQSPWLLRFAGGSPGAALLAIECKLYSWHQALEPALAGIDKGAPTRETASLGVLLSRLVEERAKEEVEGKPTASKDAANRFWAKRMLAFLAERSRGMLRRATEPGQLVRCAVMIELARQAERQVDANVQHAAVMDNLAAQMMSPSREVLAMMGA